MKNDCLFNRYRIFPDNPDDGCVFVVSRDEIKDIVEGISIDGEHWIERIILKEPRNGIYKFKDDVNQLFAVFIDSKKQ